MFRVLKCILTISFFIIPTDALFASSPQDIDSINTTFRELISNQDFDGAEAQCDLLEQLADEYKSPNLYLTSKLRRIDLFSRLDMHDQALKMALETYKEVLLSNYIPDSDSIPNSKCEAFTRLTRVIVENMEKINRYETCLGFLDKLESIGCYTPKTYSILYFEKARILLVMDKKEAAIQVMQDHIAVLEDNKDANASELISAYNQLGIIAKNANELDLSLTSFNNSIDIIDKTGDKMRMRPVILGNIGSCYYLKGDNSNAYEYLNQDSDGSKKGNQFGSFFRAELNLAQIDRENGQLLRSVKRLETIYDHYKISDLSKIELEVLKELYSLHNELGNSNSAFAYLELYTELNDSLYFKNEDEIMKIESAYTTTLFTQTVNELERETAFYNQENTLLKRDHEITWRNNILMIIILLLVISFISVIFYKYKGKQQLKEEIQANELRLAQKSLSLEKANKELLEIKVKNENEKIQSLALELVSKKKFSESLIAELRKLEGVSNHEIRSLELLVRNELDLKSSRVKFQKDINQLGEEFFSKLKTTHKDLNDRELKLCSMIVLKLTNKEIAISRNISPNSVKIAKNRLKKKLQITDLNLHEYLRNYLS